MEAISVLDIFKIGVGPSSSHTMGPWRAAERFVRLLREQGVLETVTRVRCDLYGSLAKTGKGHGTDVAVVLGLCGEDPVTCATAGLVERVAMMREAGVVRLGGQRGLPMDFDTDIVMHMDQTHPAHPNAMRLRAEVPGREPIERTYFSVGGGFVVEEGESLGGGGGAGATTGSGSAAAGDEIESGDQILAACEAEGLTIPGLVRRHEHRWRTDGQLDDGILRIWRTMLECIYRGCHAHGTLPGGLEVTRRAGDINARLLRLAPYDTLEGWVAAIRGSVDDFQHTLKWVSTFALAVNEENAAFGRVVTAPTNGAAGVVPAVLAYYWCFRPASERGVIDFLLTAGQIAILFKKGATLSAAMGGCQAEIGVSSAMAAAGLAQVMGGSVGQVLMAAEIAMEHHLGMTCDPVGGLVQVPCIERNTMGAMKAITAASIAIESDPAKARVSLDEVIATMWATAKDMQAKYKETSDGGLALAVRVAVAVPEC